MNWKTNMKNKDHPMWDRIIKYSLIIGIIITITIFVIIGLILLNINYMFNEEVSETLKNSIINSSCDAYNIKESVDTVTLIAELNNSAFNNNFLFFLYSLITTLLCGAGFYVLRRSLKSKDKVEKLIKGYEKANLELNARIKTQTHFENINLYLDLCNNYLIFELLFTDEKNPRSKSRSSVETKARVSKRIRNIVKVRDFITQLKVHLIVESQANKNDCPFNNYEQVELLKRKADGLYGIMSECDYKDNLKVAISDLAESIKIFEKWLKDMKQKKLY